MSHFYVESLSTMNGPALLFSRLKDITTGHFLALHGDQLITSLITDSRKASAAQGAVFFAIRGPHHDGHEYIPRLYDLGIRQFVVEKPLPEALPGVNILQVQSSLKALQDITAFHRSRFTFPVIGITGSNGKTIIKEWLYQLLSPGFKIVKNPASYNSQLGVPLSVWQIQEHHTLGIFEAGISTVDEMQNLQRVMRPTLGIFSNIGSAHDEGFKDTEEKVREKLMLFRECEQVFYCADHSIIRQAIQGNQIRGYAWGSSPRADVKITREGDAYRLRTAKETFLLKLPFSDAASIENCFHCVMVMLHFGLMPHEIQERIAGLRSVPMRLELKEGINQCQVIDDTYNNDLAGLQVSLDFLSHQHVKQKKRLILSDIHESGLPDQRLMQKIALLLSSANVQHFVGIGPTLQSHQEDFPQGSAFYKSTEDFLRDFDFRTMHNETILIKGARVFAFEKIVNRIQRKVHGTVMEIDLGALVHNLNFYKSRLMPETRIMAMVKAFAYGSGSNQVANVLQYHQTDYLGVAYPDEGIELRKNNIGIPIMVMNAPEESFETLLQYQLEPEMYNFRVLHELFIFLQGRPCKVHIKIDTGMRRLGFEEEEIEGLITLLRQNPHVKVASIFSHLAVADEEAHDAFSRDQANRFMAMAGRISQALGYRPIHHILNSSGVLRFPEFQLDMVRLGIGLYGIDPTETIQPNLRTVATLKTVISQLKHVPAGESIGYGRKGAAAHPRTTATLAIGYADGFRRAFSQGVGKVLVHGKSAPVIGNVCMDMTMIDVTDIPCREGDEVVIFGNDLPIRELARRANTIPYEILTNTSERVKRIFVAEGI